MSDDILPIEIRPGYFVLVSGIPHDLSPDEARKIAGVVLAMVAPVADLRRLTPSRKEPTE